jgi:hypothetical protein
MTTPARRAADAYIDAINSARYDAIGALFAVDAVFLSPHGQTVRGRDAIGNFFSEHLSSLRPEVRGRDHVDTETQCVVHIQTKNPETDEFELTAIDHFIVDDAGMVLRMDVFLRGSESAFDGFVTRYGTAEPA